MRFFLCYDAMNNLSATYRTDGVTVDRVHFDGSLEPCRSTEPWRRWCAWREASALPPFVRLSTVGTVPS